MDRSVGPAPACRTESQQLTAIFNARLHDYSEKRLTAGLESLLTFPTNGRLR